MPKIYVGNQNNIAKKAKRIYIGNSSDLAKRCKKIYVGDSNNVARLAYANIQTTLRLLGGYGEYYDVYVDGIRKGRTNQAYNYSSSPAGYYSDYPLELDKAYSEITYKSINGWQYPGADYSVDVTSSAEGQILKEPVYNKSCEWASYMHHYFYSGVNVEPNDYVYIGTLSNDRIIFPVTGGTTEELMIRLITLDSNCNNYQIDFWQTIYHTIHAVIYDRDWVQTDEMYWSGYYGFDGIFIPANKISDRQGHIDFYVSPNGAYGQIPIRSIEGFYRI